jgi:CBS domain containing-hemolysin-like protein
MNEDELNSKIDEFFDVFLKVVVENKFILAGLFLGANILQFGGFVGFVIFPLIIGEVATLVICLLMILVGVVLYAILIIYFGVLLYKNS